MPEVQARDEAIRQARRMGDPAAVCAALAVMSAWEADEARGRDLLAQFLQGGLLTDHQLQTLIGIEVAGPGGGELQPTAAGAAEPALQPDPVAVAVLEAPEPPAPASPPIETPPPVAAVPTTSEIGAAEAPPAVRETRPARPSRKPLIAAAFLGVAVAVAFWLRFGGDRPQAAAPPPPRPAPAPMPAAPRLAPFPSAPLPPLAPPARPPVWAPRLREVREGDSSAVHDRLSRLGSSMLDASGTSFEAQELVARRPRKDRIVAWVELTLGRFHAVQGLQSRLGDDSETVDVAWARE